MPTELPTDQRTLRPGTRLLAITTIVLTVLLAVLAGPVRTTALRYGTGAAEAARIAVVNTLKGPVRVGVQIGHLDAHLHPEEHAALRFNTGGHAAGLDELTVNMSVAEELSALLEAAGVTVDLLPASVPVHYSADAVVSLHADSVADDWRSGYKSSFFEPQRNSSDPLLKEHIDSVFLAGSGLRDDSLNTSGTMIHYYAFNPAYRHSVNPRSPALLVEMGYISNSADRRFLLQPGLPAQLIADGLLSFLRAQKRLPPAVR